MLFFIRAHTNQQSGIPRAIEFGTRVAAPSVLEYARGDTKGTTLARWYRSSEEGFLEGSVTSSERSLPLKEDYRKGTTVSSTNKKNRRESQGDCSLRTRRKPRSKLSREFQPRIQGCSSCLFAKRVSGNRVSSASPIQSRTAAGAASPVSLLCGSPALLSFFLSSRGAFQSHDILENLIS